MAKNRPPDADGEPDRPRYINPKEVARQLNISLRQAERLAADGAFGPRIRIGYRTVRVQQAGVDAYVRRLEGGA